MDTKGTNQQFIRLCTVPSEIEASMIVQMLGEEDIYVTTDASAGSTIFGGLPFESGHNLYVTQTQLEKAKSLLAKHPHFKGLDQPEEV